MRKRASKLFSENCFFSKKPKKDFWKNTKFHVDLINFLIEFRLCFTKLKLLLLAIEIKGNEGVDAKISINPRSAKLQANTQGFFIAQSADEVKRFLSIMLMLMLIQTLIFIN